MRTARSVFAVMIAVAIAIHLPSVGHTAAPMVKTQAPGFYRMMLGDFEVTALNDGVVPYMTSRVLPGATQEEVSDSLAAMGLSDPVGMSYNAFLINTGSRLVLIDTGTGGKLSDTSLFRGAGRLLANLRAAGYQPEHVDEIYITHLGPDHVGGLTLGTDRTFPNAVLRAANSEVDLFLGKKAPVKDWRLPFWTDLFTPYIKAAKFESFNEDVALTPGIRAMATHGHSPGHTSYLVESGGQRLLVLGDLVLMGAMQFARPSLRSPFDTDGQAAAAQRERVLQLASERDYWVAGAHLSFPGIGHIRAEQKGYRWIPANYAITQ